ncbi:MAG: hypothetical protein OSJ60_08650 [Lachnospiraceae bacterium]|nr:hypothetical protein [Lachnospiraceae bacterium]
MKHLLLNKDNVIIDVVDDVKYVKKNENNLVVLCHQHDAQGYIASNNESIHAKFGTQFKPDYTDIASEATVEDDIAEEIVPRKFKYINGEVVENEDPYPEDNLGLTNATAQNEANIEYIAMMTGVEV